MPKLNYVISPATHYNEDHEHYDTYVGRETKSGKPRQIMFKCCGKTEQLSKETAGFLADLLNTIQDIKK